MNMSKEKVTFTQLDKVDKREKILVVDKPEIIVEQLKEKPYFEIKDREVGKDKYNVGFGSYDLNNCFRWLEEDFEIVDESLLEYEKDISVKEIAKSLSFEDKLDICSLCEDFGKCARLHNSECPVLIEKVKEGLVDSDSMKEERKEKVVQFPVNMDEVQRNILVGLMNARMECMEENILSARGFEAIIDALFYLVKERPLFQL